MKTAVEWLVEQITDSTMPAREAIKQAKEMEKEQMLECYLKADVFPRKYEFEKWYNETFKSE